MVKSASAAAPHKSRIPKVPRATQRNRFMDEALSLDAGNTCRASGR
jgi:hypothetical protein